MKFQMRVGTHSPFRPCATPSQVSPLESKHIEALKFVSIWYLLFRRPRSKVFQLDPPFKYYDAHDGDDIWHWPEDIFTSHDEETGNDYDQTEQELEDNHHDAQKENGVLEEEPNQLSLQNDQEDTSGPEDESEKQDEWDRSGFSEDENVSDTEPDVVVDAEVDQFADDSADEREVSQE